MMGSLHEALVSRRVDREPLPYQPAFEARASKNAQTTVKVVYVSHSLIQIVGSIVVVIQLLECEVVEKVFLGFCFNGIVLSSLANFVNYFKMNYDKKEMYLFLESITLISHIALAALAYNCAPSLNDLWGITLAMFTTNILQITNLSCRIYPISDCIERRRDRYQEIV